MIDHKAFETAKNRIIGSGRERMGIGTLSEKTVHAIFKNYCEPDTDYHEVPLEGYVADIYRDGKITEIQTRSFERLRDKLKAFLPLYEVCVVHPIPRDKWVIWINEETGETSEKHKSPKHGNPYSAFDELYKIKMYLNAPTLKIKFIFTDMEEYRLLNGWSKDKKRGSERYDRIPLNIVSEIDITCPNDYMQFVPAELGEIPFTSSDFAKAAHINRSHAQLVLNILSHTGVVEKTGKKGKSFLYRVKY